YKAETWRSMVPVRAGGQTTVIQRILERRAQHPPAIQDDTTATIAVMLRVLPPPRALLAIGDSVVRTQVERLACAEVLDFQAAADESEALSLFTAEFRPVVITDSLELIRKLRALQSELTPFIVFVAELDEAEERESGLVAGADERSEERRVGRGGGG